MKGEGKRRRRYALAVPDTELFRRYLNPVKYALKEAGIGVFLVGFGGKVLVFTNFRL
jgi:hypothetical protein